MQAAPHAQPPRRGAHRGRRRNGSHHQVTRTPGTAEGRGTALTTTARRPRRTAKAGQRHLQGVPRRTNQCAVLWSAATRRRFRGSRLVRHGVPRRRKRTQSIARAAQPPPAASPCSAVPCRSSQLAASSSAALGCAEHQMAVAVMLSAAKHLSTRHARPQRSHLRGIGVQLKAKCVDNFENRIEAWSALAGQRFVEALA